MYAPNEDRPEFFHHVHQIIESFENCNIIWGGDFNLVLNTEEDRYSSDHNNYNACDKIYDCMSKLDLADVWRIHNPNKRVYTWQRGQSMSRIDLFLINTGLLNRVMDVSISHIPLSDHDPVILKMISSEHSRGPGLWKLNTSHLNNKEFLDGLNDAVAKALTDTEFMDPNPRWETIKSYIHLYCIKKSKQITTESKRALNDLLDKVKNLKAKQQVNPSDFSTADQTQLAECETEVQELLEKKAKGCILRCKLQWHSQGQRSSKYFFSLEKSKANKKRMLSLRKEDGSITRDQNEILEEQVKFYKQLYQKNDLVEYNIQIPDDQPKLN